MKKSLRVRIIRKLHAYCPDFSVKHCKELIDTTDVNELIEDINDFGIAGGIARIIVKEINDFNTFD